jgi:uncharacterized membrane protein YkvA (DUF1232 family)
LTLEKNVTVDCNATQMPKTSGLELPESNLAAPQPQRRPLVVGWKKQAQRLQKEAHVFYFVFKHPRTRWYGRLLAVCTAGYLFSPIQLIPSFIPVIGLLDDFAVLFLGAKMLEKITPPDVLDECRELADTAETSRREEIRGAASFFAPIAVVIAWLLAAMAVSALLAAYIYH